MHRAVQVVIACVLLYSAPAFAAGGYVHDAAGDVSVIVGKNAAHPAAKNDPVAPGTEVHTGTEGYAVLKFEDGQVATMQANTTIYVREYRYDTKLINKNSVFFSRFSGGMRFITGLIGQRDHKAFRLSTPNATIGIRGTEFVVAMDKGALYSQVVKGSISMANSAGVVVFKAGQTILVKTARSLPKAIPAAALPPGIFSQLDAIPTPSATPAPVPAAGISATEAVPAGVSAGAALASGAALGVATAGGGLLAGAANAATPGVASLGAGTVLGAAPLGAALPGVASSGVASSGAAPVGVALPSAAPVGVAPVGAAPVGAVTSVAAMSGSALSDAAPLIAAPSSDKTQAASIKAVPPPSAKTISLTGAGATYTGADLLCDFCTGRTKTVPTHVEDSPSVEGTVTGDASLFGKHNLTSTGANTGEICAFCHTPQGAEDKVYAPRWNRTLTTLSSYRAFSSLGSATQQATGSVSMSCLSCHDGSQAPNIVINTPDLRLDVGAVRVDTGNDLKNHHPVGIQYAGGGQDQNAPDIALNPIAAFDRLVDMNQFSTGNKFSAIYSGTRPIFDRSDVAAMADVLSLSNEGNFTSLKGGFNKSTYSGTGTGTVWWVKSPNSKKGRQKTDLYLFTRADMAESLGEPELLDRPYVECATCHDPHSVNPTFLRMPGGNARSQICLTCHNK